jgi:tetratricopeptide (TPR) repeat protein
VSRRERKVVVRDVAYGQIARADRAEKHRGVAEWIEGLGRPEDHAEMLAHHWLSAFDLYRAAGMEAPEVARSARHALREAGDRAAALNAYPTAEKYYAEALALWPDADREHPDLLFRRARSLHIAGDDRRRDALEEARAALLAVGEAGPAAEAEAFLAHGAWYRGDRDTAERHFSQAEALVADSAASASKTRVLALSARFRMLKGDHEQAIRVAQEALGLAEELTLDELRAHALTTIGSSKNYIELNSGHVELEQALDIALAADSPIAATTLNNLAVLAIWEGAWHRAYELYFQAERLAERFGDRDGLRFVRGNRIFGAWARGYWDEALADADVFIAECASSPHYAEGLVREGRASLRLARGDLTGAAEDRQWTLEQAHRVQDPQRIIPTLASSAVGLVLLGNEDEARAITDETIALVREHVGLTSAANHLALVAGRLGIRDELRELVELSPEGPWKDLTLAAAQGDLVRAGDLYAQMGAPTFEAVARLLAGEELLETGRRAEGEEQLEKALTFYRSVGATFFIQRAERLLAAAQSASA